MGGARGFLGAAAFLVLVSLAFFALPDFEVALVSAGLSSAVSGAGSATTAGSSVAIC